MERYFPWLHAELGINVNYDVVHNLVRYKLKAKLKVPRPKSYQQDSQEIESFKKNSQEICSHLKPA